MTEYQVNDLMCTPVEWGKNEFPIPHHQWREAEDRANKYKMLYELAEQEISALKWKLEELHKSKK